MLLYAHVADVRDSRNAQGREGDVDCHVEWLGGRVATRGWVGSRRERGHCGVHRHGCPAMAAEPVTLRTLPSSSSVHDLLIVAAGEGSMERVAALFCRGK